MFNTNPKRFKFAAAKAGELFRNLNLTDEQIDQLADHFANNFKPDYSPVPEEQSSPGAIGNGTDAVTYLAVVGSWFLNVEEDKVNIDPDRYWSGVRRICAM